MKILVLDNYDSFTYNLVQYLGTLGAEIEVHRNDAISVSDLAARPLDGLVISPGPGEPRDAGISEDALRALSGKVPILGVCLGHQAMGQVYGGKVIRAPNLMHGKLSSVANTGKGVFKGLPRAFEATRYHSLIVERDTLPDSLEITAETGGLIMGMQHKTHPVHGVQFHPESIASEHGHALLANFLELAGMAPRRRNAPAARVAAA